MGTSLLAKLQRRFSHTRLLRTRDDLIPLREGGRDAEWVISRGLSLFIGVNCANVPRKRREAFVATAVRRAAPFAVPDWHAAWNGDQAMVWVWPQEELTAGGQTPAADFSVRAEAGEVSYVRRFLPESLLRGEPMESGVELVACSDGVEARAWRQGSLYASNWWPQLPDRLAWITFCRGAGMSPAAMPEVRQVPWRDAPWTVSGNNPLRDSLGQVQRYAVPALSAGLLIWASFQAGSLVRLKLAGMALDRQIAESSAQVSDILSARSQAQDDLARARALLALRPPAPQLRLLAEVAGVLEHQGATLKSWSMPNPDHVEVTASMASPDPRALVLAFQQSGAFSDVSADVGRASKDQLVIRAQVKPPALSTPAPVSAEPAP